MSFYLQPVSLFWGCFKELKTEENKNLLGSSPDHTLMSEVCSSGKEEAAVLYLPEASGR